MEKLIPITKKQHDAIQSLTDVVRANQKQLETVAAVILMGVEDAPEQCGIVGARATDGVYSLVVEVPDIAPKPGADAETPAA